MNIVCPPVTPVPGSRAPAALPGLALIAAAGAALVVANSPLAPGYAQALHAPLGPLDLRQWIDDALMALFFFAVGLEVKRETVRGGLADARARRLPVIVAACGMIAPALVYLAASGFDAALAPGWAIPAATDIAFALGVLALLGARAPPSLRLLLATVAIADDVGAVAIIAFGYTHTLDPLALGAAAALVGALWLVGRRGVRALWPYLLLGVLLWIAVQRSGVHPTIAGVAAALCVPCGLADDPGPLERLEHALAPWVAYLVLPLFAFANAGVALDTTALLAPLPLAIMAGLFVGKQAGVFAALRVTVALGIGVRPAGASWPQLYGVALLTGIGFTMSLFIAGLAFADPALVDRARAGILAGSLLSGVAGWLVLRFAR